MTDLDPETTAYLQRLVDEAPPLTPEAAALFTRTFYRGTSNTPAEAQPVAA